MKKKIIFLGLIFLASIGNAQVFKGLGKDIENKLKNKAEEKVNRHIDKTINNADKKTDEEIENVKQKTTEKKSKSNASKEDKKGGKKFNSASDFIAGTKILATENFSQDAVGDFPVNWLTNSSGEINTISGTSDKCLFFSDAGTFTIKNFNKTLPKNFTFEFNLDVTEKFSFYSTEFSVVFAQVSNLKKDYVSWTTGLNKGKNGVMISVHPTDASGDKGQTNYASYENNEAIAKNSKSQAFFTQNKNSVRVQFWRQNQRLRMYIDGNKVWDLPNAFGNANYNSVIFCIDEYWRDHINDRYFISNIVLAEAGEDTRHKLIETGAFTTNEILFNVNKATIIPSETSEKVLSDIGTVLKETPDFKVVVIGHTDSDGNDEENLKLSLKRAESVKEFLVREYGIDKNRIKTEGKGETQPVADNNTKEGKAQNRRVEFKKL